MRTTLKHRFAAESSIGFNDGQITKEQRDQLLERYRTEGYGASSVIRALAMFALFCVGSSILALLAAMSQSLFGAAILLALLSGVALRSGVALTTKTPRNRNFTGSALITAGLMTSYGFLCVLYLLIGGTGSDAVPYTVNMYIVAVLGFALAYRTRTTTPLIFAIICLFHAVGGPHRPGAEVDDFFDLQDQLLIACAAAIAVLFGFYHERVLEQSVLKDHADFGDIWIKLGLLYLNCTLFSNAETNTLHHADWSVRITIFAVLVVVEVLLGAAIADARLLGFGAIALQALAATRTLAVSHDTTRVAAAFLVQGIVAIGLGFALNRTDRARRLSSLAGPAVGRILKKELAELVRLGIFTPGQRAQLRERYTLNNWELGGVGRWFTISGSLITLLSLCVLIHERFEFTLTDVAFVLTVSVIGLLLAAHHLRARGRLTAAAATEFLSALGFMGWSAAVAKLLSTGSNDPTALVFADACVILAMAYYYRNVSILYLGHALIYCFAICLTNPWFHHGPHATSFNPPLRLLLAATLLGAAGLAHLRRDGERSFARAWLFSALLVGELSLCVLAVEGNSGHAYGQDGPSIMSLLFFNAVLAGLNAVLIHSSRYLTLPMLGQFGVAFAIIHPYVLFFRYLAVPLGPILSFFIAGASGLALVANLEAFSGFRKQAPSDIEHSGTGK